MFILPILVCAVFLISLTVTKQRSVNKMMLEGTLEAAVQSNPKLLLAAQSGMMQVQRVAYAVHVILLTLFAVLPIALIFDTAAGGHDAIFLLLFLAGLFIMTPIMLFVDIYWLRRAQFRVEQYSIRAKIASQKLQNEWVAAWLTWVSLAVCSIVFLTLSLLF